GTVQIDLSRLPSLSARPYRGPADHAAMANMINRWHRAVGTAERVNAADLDSNNAHLVNCDLPEDMLVVEDAAGTLAGYTRTDWWQVVDGERKYAVFAKVDPDWKATALPYALLAACHDRALAIASAHSVDCPQVLEGWAEEHEAEWMTAYRSLGFSPVTYGAMMVRPHLEDLPDAPLPDGLEIRPVEASHLRTIWEADTEAFRDHWGFSEPSEEDWGRFLDFPHRDESLWKVAWEGDRVVGQVRSFINPDENADLGVARGWTENISTHRDWRRRGVAKALICESMRELKARGMTEAALGVHTENPNGAFALYESLGYEVRERHTTFQKLVA
ncbi:MAG TPA: GNAT family N-acetyltransferase, partial [Acidimicrobiia bacterium]|nr:GNAT family N-acetyltransferase [Acidimicrobiia bacterium]